MGSDAPESELTKKPVAGEAEYRLATASATGFTPFAEPLAAAANDTRLKPSSRKLLVS